MAAADPIPIPTCFAKADTYPRFLKAFNKCCVTDGIAVLQFLSDRYTLKQAWWKKALSECKDGGSVFKKPINASGRDIKELFDKVGEYWNKAISDTGFTGAVVREPNYED